VFLKGDKNALELNSAGGNSGAVFCTRIQTNERASAWDYVDYSRLPQFLHDNEFLTRRHRPQLNSVIECLKSAFMLHSETWNIWTHVFGSSLFLM